jgi:hypothetical protein
MDNKHERGPKNVTPINRPLNEVELEIARADIAYLKQKEIDSGDWDKWVKDQAVNNRGSGVFGMPQLLVNTSWRITREMFFNAVGCDPIQDDLDRCNCHQAGKLGHWSCGWCESCNCPVLKCGHRIMGRR